jgi:rhodanese-related sulfurtransferase
MTADALMARLESGVPTTILDVRSSVEFRRGHVPGACHLPFWAAGVARLPPAAASTPVVVYCGHGPRARMAARLLRWRGLRDLHLLDGHMTAWRRSGRPEEGRS